MRDVVALFLERESNPYMESVRLEAEAEAASHGLVVDVRYADNRFDQIEQLHAVIRAAAPPRALAVFPANEESLGRVAKAALKRGIHWICLHRKTGDLEELQREFPDGAVTFISPHQVEIGRLQGRLARRLAMGGRVLYVQGSKAHFSSAQRLAGFREVIDPRREIVGIIDGNWAAQDAREAAERWLHVMLPSVGRVDLAVCQSDVMAVGVKEALAASAAALKRPELARVPLIGCDGMPNGGRRLVDDGELAATVILQGVGGAAVRAVVERRAGRRPAAEIILSPAAYPPLPVDTNDARELMPRARPA